MSQISHLTIKAIFETSLRYEIYYLTLFLYDFSNLLLRTITQNRNLPV